MKKNSKTKPPVSAESVAWLAENGKDVSSHFAGKGKMMPERSEVKLMKQQQN
jgi:hypothetical protein